jgi:hypothetical protein
VGLRQVSVATSVWSLGYAGYRLHYGVGGTMFVPGVIASPVTFRIINGVAAMILAVGEGGPG